MRIMALDVGSRTIGIACSDALLMTAQGIETIRRTSLENDFSRLRELISEYEVHELVVGMPKNMNGTKGDRAENGRVCRKNEGGYRLACYILG